MRRRSMTWLVVTAVTTLALGACSSGTETKPAASDGPSTGTFPVTVGTTKLEHQPKRIVSLSPTATEMLFAIGAGSQVAAVDNLSNYPVEAPKSDLEAFKPNAEAISAKNPDLVVLSNDTNKIVDQLTKLKIPVFLTPAAKTLDDSYAQLTDLGTLTGNTDRAATVVGTMRKDIAALAASVKPRAKKPTYFHEIDQTLYTTTSSSFLGSVYTMAGLTNVADAAAGSGEQYPQLSAETVIKANPDLYFLADSKCCQQSAETVKARPGFADIAAVRNNRVIVLDDDIASRWGPRIVDLLRAVIAAAATVPEA